MEVAEAEMTPPGGWPGHSLRAMKRSTDQTRQGKSHGLMVDWPCVFITYLVTINSFSQFFIRVPAIDPEAEMCMASIRVLQDDG